MIVSRARLERELAAKDAVIADLQTQIADWKGKAERLIDANLARAGTIHEPTMVNRDRVVGVEPGNSNQFSYLNYRDLRDSGIFEMLAG